MLAVGSGGVVSIVFLSLIVFLIFLSLSLSGRLLESRGVHLVIRVGVYPKTQ